MKEQRLIVIHEDINEPEYQYSEGLFDWFYANALYYSHDGLEWHPLPPVINIEWTRKDHQNNGCRIWFNPSGYVKLSETFFLFNVPDGVEIEGRIHTVLSNVVDAYYKHLNSPSHTE